MAAGDFYQGSLWYTSFKYKVIDDFVPEMHYDIISLGNHEFDDQVEGLLPFINATRKIGLPIVCANIDYEVEPRLKNIKKSYIFNKGGHKIGVIGYLTPDTLFLSSPDDSVHILDEIESIKQEVKYLKEQGVDVFIALGHSGYWKDMEIAKNIPELDVVVGGHTNSFLWSKEFGPPPSKETPVGDYPTVIEDIEGGKTLVVSAYAYGKYLGKLDLDIDDKGNIVHYGGRPILMDATISQETKADLKERVAVYQKSLVEKYSESIGKSNVYLEGVETACRMRECSMGNFICDAFVHAFLDKGRKSSDKFWTNYPIAINSGGYMRTAFNASDHNGTITLGDMYAILPFDNYAVAVTVTGKTLKSMFEHSISAYDPDMKRLEGRFLQVSGIKVVYDVSRPIGDRVIHLMARCGNCEVPVFEEVVETQKYTFLTNDYIAKGGDGYEMLLKDDGVSIDNFDTMDIDIMTQYLQQRGTVTQGLEGRIVVTSGPTAEKYVSNSANGFFVSYLSIFGSLLIALQLLASTFTTNVI
jgi:5'-nucleotidase